LFVVVVVHVLVRGCAAALCGVSLRVACCYMYRSMSSGFELIVS